MDEGDDEELDEDDELFGLPEDESVDSDSFAVLVESESCGCEFSSAEREKDGVWWWLFAAEVASEFVSDFSEACCDDLASSLNFSTLKKSDRFGMR